MDITFMFIAVLAVVITSIVCLVALSDWGSSGSKEAFCAFGIAWCISAAVIIWDGLAMHNLNSTPIVTTHPIEVKYNTPYFFGPKNEVHELTGNSRFVDVEKFHIKWVVVPGGWKYGMYVTETVNWDIAPKEQVEAASH